MIGLTLNGLGGDDVINASSLEAGGIQLTMNGGLGEDILIGSEGGDLFNGGDGNDTALMGAGDDVFVWNPGDDNDTIEGQAGVDRLDFNGAIIAEKIDISANGGRVRSSPATSPPSRWISTMSRQSRSGHWAVPTASWSTISVVPTFPSAG